LYTYDGNSDFRNNGKLINFDKYAKTAKIINELIKYQQPYPLTDVPEIQEYLLQSIQDRGTRNPEELYELSLRLEPREERNDYVADDPGSELEAKIKMLQQAGML
jgi:hypothetical protein